VSRGAGDQRADRAARRRKLRFALPDPALAPTATVWRLIVQSLLSIALRKLNEAAGVAARIQVI
jgi:hypothetical protein